MDICIPLKHERVFFFECSQAAITSVRTRLQMMFFTAIENRANGTPIMFFYTSGERIREFNCCCCSLVRRLVIDIIVLLRTLSLIKVELMRTKIQFE